MNDDELKQFIDEIRDVGGEYAQAKKFLETLPSDIRKTIFDRRRKKQNVQARAKIVCLLKDRYDLSLPAIAELLQY